jgi:hypothetical protein
MCITKFPPLVRAKIHVYFEIISEIADKNKANPADKSSIPWGSAPHPGRGLAPCTLFKKKFSPLRG